VTTLDTLYERFGQSPWIDNIRRDWLDDGTLAHLVERGVRGVTSNPSIFAKALATSSAYDAAVAAHADLGTEELFETLAVGDVRDACDVLSAVHRDAAADFDAGRRRYGDGFVSLEVSPRLAHDTEATVSAALRLAAAVDRPNALIKIPATLEGLPAITAVLGAGVNVNVTLIFSIARYSQVLDAWMAGLEFAAANGHDLARLASVASFFVSRVDTAVDALLGDTDPRRGTTANAQAARAYQLYRDRVGGERVSELLAAGAQVQRPLWASTSVKNPAYDELLYVERLVADETVNTMPDATLDATLARGTFDSSPLLEPAATSAVAFLVDDLPTTISLEAVTDRLEAEGVASFAASYEELLATLEAKLARTGP